VLFAIEATVFFFAIILAEQLVRRAGAAQEQATTAAPVARSLLVLPADYGLLCLAFVVSGLPTVFVPLYSVLMVLNVGILLAALPRWFRRLSAIS
jgi:hypothetical protein